ncbi:MAG: DUF5320 domain-containing protein [Candidatus Thorarchaeota archaeon]
MCDEHRGRGYGHFFMGPGFYNMCCSPKHDGLSKETRIKYLEAMKSKLEDRIKHIDQRIEKIQKGEAQEV